MTSTPVPKLSPTLDPLAACADAPQQGLQIGDRVYVCTQSNRLMLRAEPDRNADEVTQRARGTTLSLIGGPTCPDGWLWWQVQTANGVRGWVAEGGAEPNAYFICTAQPCEPVTGAFAGVWPSVQDEVGCATAKAFQGLVAEEHFEGGIMFWREAFDNERSPVLFNNGTWRYYTHTRFVEGSPDFSCVDENTPAQCPPTPKRGFGMMWCDIPELRQRLGDALDCERGYQATMQTFAGGFLLRNDRGDTHLWLDNGTWRVLR